MAIEYPLGSPSYRGNTDGALPRKFEGDLVAGVAVSLVTTNGSQPTVTAFNGSSFAGFAVHDLCTVRKVASVIKTGEGICLKIKAGESLTPGGAFAVDNISGEIVAAGAADSTTIMGDVAEIGVNGIDQDGKIVEGCGLFNVYGGVAPAGTGGSSGIPEAPTDGVAYVRQNGDWVAETVGVEEAPSDGTPYERQDAGWVAASAAAASPTPESGASKTATKK
ncbi:TPA: hypothetical protein ACVU43_003022 [Vibrio parahaemolyticus]|nr:hypothetical protein [Vibrio parahaemolyticus]